MTPLAQTITNDLLARVVPPSDELLLMKRLQRSDAHCFDVSAVWDLAFQLTKKEHWDPSSSETRVFLPYPTTWIEGVNSATGSRMGVLFTKFDATDPVPALIAAEAAGEFWHCQLFRIAAGPRPAGYTYSPPNIVYWLADGRLKYLIYNQAEITDMDRIKLWRRFWLATLALINTPRIFDRVEHASHAGLERKIARAAGAGGRFRLQPWHAIKLEIFRPREDGKPGTEKLTGSRALHWCRQHIRVRFGKAELVTEHERGNAAVGIAQSYYNVQRPKDLHP